MTDIRQGGCLCGKVRYEMDVANHETTICHCTECRRHSGAPFTTHTTVPKAQFQWLSPPDGAAKSSEFVTRRFCTHCGTPFNWENPKFTRNMSIITGTLDNPVGVAPSMEIFTKSRLDWLSPIAGMKQYDEEP